MSYSFKMAGFKLYDFLPVYQQYWVGWLSQENKWMKMNEFVWVKQPVSYRKIPAVKTWRKDNVAKVKKEGSYYEWAG